jgi:hypothetical protein
MSTSVIPNLIVWRRCRTLYCLRLSQLFHQENQKQGYFTREGDSDSKTIFIFLKKKEKWEKKP